MSGGQGIGALAGGVVGGAVGFFAGGNIFLGASLGSTLGGAIGGAIDPPKANLPNIRGPFEFVVNTFHRNMPVPLLYGIDRVGGNIIWMGALKTETRKSGGGKGKPETQSVIYSAQWALCLTEGEITSIGRVWINEQEVRHLPGQGKALLGTIINDGWSPSPDDVLTPLLPGGTAFFQVANDSGQGISVSMTAYPGNASQTADSRVVAELGASAAPAFRHTGYVLIDGQIGQSPQLPQFALEVARSSILGGVGLQVCFPGWSRQDSWDMNYIGSMELRTTNPDPNQNYPLWWIDNTQDPTKFFSSHRAKDVLIDLDGDFDLYFYQLLKYSILETGVNDFGFAFLRDSDDLLLHRWTMSGFGFIVTGPGWFAGVESDGIFNDGTVNIDLFRNFGAENDIRGNPAEARVWWRIEKRGNTVSSYYKQVADPDWNLHSSKVMSDAELAGNSPARFHIYCELTTTQLNQNPTMYIRDVFFCYKAFGSVSYASRGNPAIVTYDYLTNTRYGMGIPTDNVDIESFSIAANFCDQDPNNTPAIPPTTPPEEEVVPPEGVSADPRFRFDLAFTDKKQNADILQDILSTCRGYLVWQGGKVFMGIEKIEQAQQAFADDPVLLTSNKGLMIRDSFSWTEIDSRERPNKVRIEYVRFEDQYRRDFVIAQDQDDQELRQETIERTIQLLGIKRQGQAKRMAQYYLDLAINTRFRCQFRVSINAMESQVGDIVSVSHEDPGWINRLFRIVGIREEPNEELSLELIEFVPEVYLDRDILGEIPITSLIAPDLFVNPPNAIRVRAFEARDDSRGQLFVTWGLLPIFPLYADAFLFRRRSIFGTFEGIGNFAVDAITGYLTHNRVGFEEEVEDTDGLSADGILFIEDFAGTLDKYTIHLDAQTGATLGIVNGELEIVQFSNAYAHIHRTGFDLPRQFIASCSVRGESQDGVSWGPGLGILWNKDNWIRLINDTTGGKNLRIEEMFNGVLAVFNPDGTGPGDTLKHFYQIEHNNQWIIYSTSDDGINWTEKRRRENLGLNLAPKSGVGLMFGKGTNEVADTEVSEWNNTSVTLGMLQTSYIDNIVVKELDYRGQTFLEAFDGDLADWDMHISTTGSGTMTIVAGELLIQQGRDLYAHMQYDPIDFAVEANFTVTAKIRVSSQDSGQGWSPGIFIAWEDTVNGQEAAWIQNSFFDVNLIVRDVIGGTFTTTKPRGASIDGDANDYWYRIVLDATNCTWFFSVNGVTYTQEHQITRPASWAGPPVAISFGKGFQNASFTNAHWDNDATVQTEEDNFMDDIAIVNTDAKPAGLLSEGDSIEIVGDVAGMSAKLFDDADVLITAGSEFNGRIILEVTDQTDPFDGYIQLYQDLNATYPALNGRFPASSFTSLKHNTRYRYTRSALAYGEDPRELRLQSVLGGFPNGGDVQVEALEATYEAFEQDLQGDKLTGITWPLEPNVVMPENRILDFIALNQEGASLVDRTSEFQTDESGGPTLFAAINDRLYFGATTKFQAILLFLNALADTTITPAIRASIDDAGNYADLGTNDGLSDGTNGFTQSGLLQFEPRVDWALTDKQQGGAPMPDSTPRYYLVIERTAATIGGTSIIGRLALIEGLELVTLQEDTNRVNYFYTDPDLNVLLRFEPLVQSIVGNVADITLRPGADIIIQRYALLPRPPAAVEIDSQGADVSNLGGDLVLNWEFASKNLGAGNFAAGGTIGAGDGSVDPTFQTFVVEIWTPGGLEFKRRALVNAVGTSGTYTYLEDDQVADGLTHSFQVRIFQVANGLTGAPRILDVIGVTMAGVRNMSKLLTFGNLWVPDMSQVEDMSKIPSLGGVRTP